MTAVRLPGVFGTLEPLLSHYGYLAVAALLLLENLGAPIVPGETMLIAGALYAGAGKLNIVVLGVVAVAAAFAGSGGGYVIGRFGGRALVLRYGRYVLLNEKRLDKAESFFQRRGAIVLTLGRFLEGLRQANGIIAGIAEMPWVTFLAFNLLGAMLWTGVWASVGYLAGDHITSIYTQVTRYLLYVLIAAGVLVVVLAGRYVIRRRRKRRTPAGDSGSTATERRP